MARAPHLFAEHLALGAHFGPVAGWEMPFHYGDPQGEYAAAYHEAVLIDTSYRLLLTSEGWDSARWLRQLLCADVARLDAGTGLHSAMLDRHGRLVDCVTAYCMAPGDFRLVVSSATADSDINWMRKRIGLAGCNLTLTGHRDYVMLTLQGPHASDILARVLPSCATALTALTSGHAMQHDNTLVMRDDRAGQLRYDLAMPARQAHSIWASLCHAGARPGGMLAANILRLEAGQPVVGHELLSGEEGIDPILLGVDLTDPERTFLGQEALSHSTPDWRLAGIYAPHDSLALHNGQEVITEHGRGHLTSSARSPGLHAWIALARLPVDTPEGSAILIRHARGSIPARVVGLPFMDASGSQLSAWQPLTADEQARLQAAESALQSPQPDEDTMHDWPQLTAPPAPMPAPYPLINSLENRMHLPTELKYALTHEWSRLEADGTVTVGITDHAQDALGDIVYLELPAAGRQVTAGETCATVESVKTASDIHAPVSGEIIEHNTQATDTPESLNQDAYATWLFRILPSQPAELASLLDADGYRASIDA